MSEVTAKPDHEQTLGQHDWLMVIDGTGLDLYREFCKVLDSGESEAMALADQHGLPLLINEKKGRTIAMRRGIPVIGLVRLLLRGVQRQFLDPDEALALLVQARSLGFRLSDTLNREFTAAMDKIKTGKL